MHHTLFIARYPFVPYLNSFHSPECDLLFSSSSNCWIKPFLIVYHTHALELTHTHWDWMNKSELEQPEVQTTEVFNGCDSRDETSFDYSSKLCVVGYFRKFCLHPLSSYLILCTVSHSIFNDFGIRLNMVCHPKKKSDHSIILGVRSFSCQSSY